MNQNNLTRNLKKLNRVIISFCSASILLLIGLWLLNLGAFDKKLKYVDIAESPSDIYYKNYDVNTLGNSEKDQQIKFGYEIFVNTASYIGPNSSDLNMKLAGNRLACNNCHLLAGAKPYSIPLIGIMNRFPQFRGRENKIGTIPERINGCMERSMNGHVLPVKSIEMKAIISYLSWLSRYAPGDGKIEGQGLMKIEIPDRAVNLSKGKLIFNTVCTVCHEQDGQGLYDESLNKYTYPPLWGEDSFNNGAGMTRVITSAQFIKANMPFGTTYLNPLLTDEEAYDVAGYMNQNSRPEMQNLQIDFPDLLKKPASTPYPPYSDPFSLEQHQLGPFAPIFAFYLKEHNIKKSK